MTHMTTKCLPEWLSRPQKRPILVLGFCGRRGEKERREMVSTLFEIREEICSHHGRDTEGPDEALVPGEKDLREVLGDGEDGRDETVAERRNERVSFSRRIKGKKDASLTYASAILASLRSGASLGLG